MKFALLVGQSIVMFALCGGRCVLVANDPPKDATWPDICSYAYHVMHTSLTDTAHVLHRRTRGGGRGFSPPPPPLNIDSEVDGVLGCCLLFHALWFVGRGVMCVMFYSSTID